MLEHKKLFAISAIVLLLFTVIGTASIVYASHVETFTVDAGYSQLFTLNLSDKDKISGSISVSGGSGNDINFWVTNPQGAKILDFGRVSQGTSFQFTADGSGAYTLHFDNGFSLLSSKVVTLSYDAQTLVSNTVGSVIWIVVAVVVILVIALIAIGIYVAVKRSGNRPPNPPK